MVKRESAGNRSRADSKAGYNDAILLKSQTSSLLLKSKRHKSYPARLVSVANEK